jgi:hypothetical protein
MTSLSKLVSSAWIPGHNVALGGSLTSLAVLRQSTRQSLFFLRKPWAIVGGSLRSLFLKRCPGTQL